MSLSTITFTGTLDATAVPVDDMRLTVELAEELDDGGDGGASAAEAASFRLDCDLVKRQAKRARGAEGVPDASRRFRHQLPLKRRGKSVKLFHNGSVHATGCTSPLEFLEMAQELERFVEDTTSSSPDAGDGLKVRLLDFDTQLINTLFLLTCPATGRPMTVAPAALLRHLHARSLTAPDQQQPADFDTERHPGVKIPVVQNGAKVATVCVFQTGSVSIMGARRPAHVALAFETACAALDECAPRVCTPDRTGPAMRTTTAKQALALADGYPFSLLSCCTQL